MSEEEFFERAINRICKDYDYNYATELKNIYLKKDKEIERLNNIINELENYIRARADDNNTCSVCSVMTDDLLNILKGSAVN